MKKHGEQNVKHKFTQTCAAEREDLTRFMSTCISILSTWTGRAKKLDEVLFLQDENSEWYATMAGP